MEFIFKILVTGIALFLAAKFVKGVYIKDFKASLITALLIIIVGFLIGWIFTFTLNLLTLGTFWIVGLGVITRTIAYAFIIEVVDKIQHDFKTEGFMPSLYLAIILALSWGLVDGIF